jgi:hypothetical protein
VRQKSFPSSKNKNLYSKALQVFAEIEKNRFDFFFWVNGDVTVDRELERFTKRKQMFRIHLNAAPLKVRILVSGLWLRLGVDLLECWSPFQRLISGFTVSSDSGF